jgi:hypothetical protein
LIICRHVYQAMVESGGVDGVGDLLNPSWVRWCFEQSFCYYVMRLGIAEYAQHKGNMKKMSWVPVPLGESRLAPCQNRALIVEGVVVKYRQFEMETCTFKAMASALHYCAAVLKKGDKELAARLASGAIGYSKGKNARDQLDTLVKVVWSKKSYFRKHQLRVKPEGLQEWDIVNKRLMWPTAVVLLGADGGQNHCVTLVNDLVFDSNCNNALRLNKQTLDWCCNCEGGFVRAVYALRFWH